MQLKDVTLAVRDLDRSVRFYERAVGLALLDSSGSTAHLGAEGAVLLHLIERPNAEPRGDEAGLFHVAWLLADRAHLGAALARLDEEGVRLTGAADHHVSEAVYLDDPDGHGIELYADKPANGWRTGGGLVMHNNRLDFADLRDAATAAGIAPEASGRSIRLGHLHLEAIDLDRASRFAEEKLALVVQLGWPNARFFAWDGYHHHLAYNDWNRRQRRLDPAAERIGLVEVGLMGERSERLTDPSGIVFDIAAEGAARAA